MVHSVTHDWIDTLMLSAPKEFDTRRVCNSEIYVRIVCLQAWVLLHDTANECS